MSELKITEFGNPILRKKARQVDLAEIKSDEVQQLIADMKGLVKSGQYGVGLAAPQIDRSLALSVITIRPTPSHPDREVYETVIINPKITEYIGKPVDKWEGCMSFGTGEPVFAQTKRHESINVNYYDEYGKQHKAKLEGMKAHVFQHEVDHLNGILFVDRVEDSKTWMNATEYKKMLASNSSKT